MQVRSQGRCHVVIHARGRPAQCRWPCTCADEAAVEVHGQVARQRRRRDCRRGRLHAQLRQHLRQ